MEVPGCQYVYLSVFTSTLHPCYNGSLDILDGPEASGFRASKFSLAIPWAGGEGWEIEDTLVALLAPGQYNLADSVTVKYLRIFQR